MSDNLCGGSNALKQFGEHADRDRSSHQDRFVNAPHAASSFRSAHHQGATPAGDQSFASFQSGAPSLGAPGGDFIYTGLNGVGVGATRPRVDPSAGWVAEYRPTPPSIAATPRMGMPANVGVAPNMMHGANHPQDGGAATSQAGPGASAAHLMGGMLRHPPPYMLGAHPMAYGGSFHAANAMVATPNAAASVSHMHQVPGPGDLVSDEDMERAFREFDEDRAFSPEMDAWLSQNVPQSSDASIPDGGLSAEQGMERQDNQGDSTFKDDMDDWMSMHGPTAAEREAAAQHEAEGELDALASRFERHIALREAVEAKRERDEAQELLDQVRPDREEPERLQQERDERDELRRTAQDIVQSIGGNDKFQSSTFLQLMRKITDGEVILDKESNDLVETNTMRPVTEQSPGPAPAATAAETSADTPSTSA